MTITHLLEAYDLHDSTLESLSFDKKTSTAIMHIDLCAWMQSGYRKGEHETKLILVRFAHVKECTYDDHSIISETILHAVPTGNGIRFVVMDDIKQDCYTLDIMADDVTVLEMAPEQA